MILKGVLLLSIGILVHISPNAESLVNNPESILNVALKAVNFALNLFEEWSNGTLPDEDVITEVYLV